MFGVKVLTSYFCVIVLLSFSRYVLSVKCSHVGFAKDWLSNRLAIFALNVYSCLKVKLPLSVSLGSLLLESKISPNTAYQKQQVRTDLLESGSDTKAMHLTCKFNNEINFWILVATSANNGKSK